MAIKGIEIKTAITEPTKTSGTVSTVYARIFKWDIMEQDDGSLIATLYLRYYRTVAAGDANATPLQGWPGLKEAYSVTITSAEWDKSAIPSTLFYDKLNTAMGADYASTAKTTR